MTSTSNLPQSLSKGYCFIGKYIGDELVPDARGNHVCRPAMDSIIRKAGYKGSSKKRISILVSSAGLKIFNGTTGYVLFDLPASKISFVYNSSYAPDFGVVFTESEKDFVFFGMRIDSNSDQVVLKCREMLEFVCQMKQMQIEQMKKERGLAAPDLITWNPPETKQDADKFSTVPTSFNSLRESTSSDPSAAQQPTSEARLAVQKRNTRVIMTSTSNLPQSLSKGYCFIGKYIGDELVPDARGNHVCRPAMDSIIRKAGYKGSSKKRISILVSSAGLKIFNGTTGYVLFDLPASKISFVYNSSYAPDFGVVFTESEKDFVFFGMRIDSNSDQVVLKCREMLEFVCQMKQMQIEQMKKERGLAAPDLITWNPPETKQDADKFSTVPTSSNSLRESTSSDPSAAQQPTSEARLAVQRRNNKTEQEQRAPPRYPFGEGFFRSQ